MMGMLHTGSNRTLLYIETGDFSLYITGNINNTKFNCINTNYNLEAFLLVNSNVYNPSVKTSNDDGDLLENNSSVMRPSFFEDGTYQIFIENNTKDTLEICHIDKEIRESISTIGRNLIGSFTFNGDIGYSTFTIKKNRKEVLSFTIEVFPSKIDYMKDYKEILNEVNEEISSLVFNFLGKTFQTNDLKDVPYQTGVEFTSILICIYDQLEKAITRIKSHPKHGVLNEEEIKNLNKAKKISRRSINEIRKHGNNLIKSNRGIVEIRGEKYFPSKIVAVKKTTTFDVYENQYVKFILKSIVLKIKLIKNNVSNIYGEENKYFKNLTLFENKLLKHINGFFKNISDIQGQKNMSLVFKMSFGYKEVYYYYMMLKKGLDISEGIYEMTPKKLWKLYEIWCYMKLHRILNDLGYETVKNGILQVTNNGIILSLTQNKQSKSTYINKQGKRVELWYNKIYNSLPTTNQKPDTVLCLSNKEKDNRIYIFDAKYRLSISDNSIIGPLEDDINVMHRYRDAIVSELGEGMQFKYDTFGAYVMFPYSNEEDFKNHRFYKSIDKVNIGAFPMLPGSTTLIKEHLSKILNETYIESKNNLPTYEAEDDYYKFKNVNVMVANVRDKKHLETYIKNNFYHMPAKEVANVRLGVEYIAFYQSKNYFRENSGVYYYAKIKDIKKYKRKECSELLVKKGSGEELYLRFELEEIKPVGPISTVEYGVELITYTTMYLLKNSETMHELSFKSRNEIEVYKILKELSKNKKLKILRRKNYFMLGDIKIEILNSKKIRVNETISDLECIRSKILEKLN